MDRDRNKGTACGWVTQRPSACRADGQCAEHAPNGGRQPTCGRLAPLHGQFAEAQRYLHIALANHDSVAHAGLASQFGQDIGVTIQLFLACNSLAPGRTMRAAPHMDEAQSLAMATGHINAICSALLMRAFFNVMSGDGPDAERRPNGVTPIAQEHNPILFLGFLPMIAEHLAAHKGDKTSVDRCRKADTEFAATKFQAFVALMRIDLPRSALAMGLRKDAAELAMMAQEAIKETGEAFALSDLHRVQAAIAMAGADAETAGRRLGAALDVARQQGGKLWERRAAIDLARLWQDQGRNAEAAALLRPVHAGIADQAAARDLLMESAV